MSAGSKATTLAACSARPGSGALILNDYAENRRLAKQGLLESDFVGRAVQLMPTRAHPIGGGRGLCAGWSRGPKKGELTWSGTATRLLQELTPLAAAREIYRSNGPEHPGRCPGSLTVGSAFARARRDRRSGVAKARAGIKGGPSSSFLAQRLSSWRKLRQMRQTSHFEEQYQMLKSVAP